MKRVFFSFLVALATSPSFAASMEKPLYTVLESTTGKGVVYMTDDEFYLNGTHDGYITSDACEYSEHRKRFGGYEDETEEENSKHCNLYFYSEANLDYGLLGFVEKGNESGIYEESDFVLDIDGKKAVSGSCVNVDDPNQPWIEATGNIGTVGDLSLYSETPNRHFYAIFTEIPEFRMEDGVDMGEAPESPTGTYTVKFTRHLNAGWNSVYLPCAFDVRQLQKTIEGSDVYAIMAYDHLNNQLFYAIGMKQVPACTPMLVYSPVECDYEYVGTDKAVENNEYINTFIYTDDSYHYFDGAFARRTVGGKCYKLDFEDNEFVFVESENTIDAFQFAFVFKDDNEAPASKRIPTNLFKGNTNDIKAINIYRNLNRIYTFDGKQLDNEPQKGVYIKDGKKIMK